MCIIRLFTCQIRKKLKLTVTSWLQLKVSHDPYIVRTVFSAGKAIATVYNNTKYENIKY